MSNYEQKTFLSNSQYQFILDKLPNVSYMSQGVALPGVSMATTTQSTMNLELEFGVDRLTYDRLDVTFIVDENLDNYSALYQWMLDITKTDDAHLSQISGATLVINNRQNIPVRHVSFDSCFPVALSPLQFALTDNTSIMLCTATFEYDRFEILSL